MPDVDAAHHDEADRDRETGPGLEQADADEQDDNGDRSEPAPSPDARRRGRDQDDGRAEISNEPIRDVRDTEPGPSERADPDQRRRVPPRDETTATVERAQLARAELDARHAVEAAEQARIVEVEPNEEDRRDDLNRWAGDDQHTASSSAGRHAAVGDDEVLER